MLKLRKQFWPPPPALISSYRPDVSKELVERVELPVAMVALSWNLMQIPL
jgi:hypothetical protein